LVREIIIDADGFTILPVDFKPKEGITMKTTHYKADTGANCSTISREWLAELGYDEEWIKLGKPSYPTLASGAIVADCYEVVIPQIRIGDWVGYNWPFLTSLTIPFRLLLGTDSMQFFNWHFDYEHDICRFGIIPGKQRLLFNQKTQAIHELAEDGIV
jgi:hypothetical protein